jgi:hypothetical protein
MFSFALVNGSCLVQLTLKRNIPNNMFLHEIGRHCPNLQVPHPFEEQQDSDPH